MPFCSTVAPKPVLSFCCIPAGATEQAASPYRNLLPISLSLVTHNTCNTGTSVKAWSSHRSWNTAISLPPSNGDEPPEVLCHTGMYGSITRANCACMHWLLVSQGQEHPTVKKKKNEVSSRSQAHQSRCKDSQCKLLQWLILRALNEVQASLSKWNLSEINSNNCCGL